MSHPTTPLSSVDDASEIAQIVERVRGVVGQSPASLHEPEFTGNEWRYVKDCLDSGWVSSVGSYVDRFEQELADISQVRSAVATVNGTAALHIALLVAGVGKGDEVLVPTLTFVATANAVSYTGATPHFVDSVAGRPEMDVTALSEHLERFAEVRGGRCINRETGAIIRAVVPMHVFGMPVDMPALISLAERWQIAVIEDAAESIGSTINDKPCGSFGRLSILSFNGNKVITTGGGGAILTDDDKLAARARHLTTTARVPHGWSFVHDEIGFNYRMPNVNAAIGCAQLEQLGSFVKRKRFLASKYSEAFEGFANASILLERQNCRSNYWLVALLLGDELAEDRDRVIEALVDVGYGVRPVWTLMHSLPMYRNCPRMNLANAERLEQQIINLPSSPRLAG